MSFYSNFCAKYFPKHSTDTVGAMLGISAIGLIAVWLTVYDQFFGQGADLGEVGAIAFFSAIVAGIYFFGKISDTKGH